MTLTDRIIAIQNLLISMQDSLVNLTNLLESHGLIVLDFADAMSLMVRTEVLQLEYFQTVAPRVAELSLGSHLIAKFRVVLFLLILAIVLLMVLIFFIVSRGKNV